MDNMRKLEEIFAHFPGIGPRQAKRFVYYLLNKPAGSVKEFTDLIHEVKGSTSACSSCHRFFIGKGGKATTCTICSDPNRDHSLLMVVAHDSDFESIEKSGAYKGLYFILGGTVPILDKETSKRIRLGELKQRVARDKPTEVILSLSATPDGENTVEVIRGELGDVKMSILGRGLSTGAELEYVDGDTIKSALANRH